MNKILSGNMVKYFSKIALVGVILVLWGIDTTNVYAGVTATILSGSPIGVQPFTFSLPITVTTNENMTCKYQVSTGAPGPPGTGPSYANMPNTFASTGGTVHTQYISAISAIGSYQYYYVMCEDQAGNFTQNNYALGFTVSPPPAPNVPTLSVSAVGTQNVLSWTASTAGSGIPVAYEIFRVMYLSGYGDVGTFGEVGETSSLTWTDPTAVAGRAYQYYVKAIVTLPTTPTSSASNTVTITTPVSTDTITATAGTNGTISPAGSVSVNNGANQTFTVIPNTGYFAQLTVDGATATFTNNTYIFSNVTTSHTIAASFISVSTLKCSVNMQQLLGCSGQVVGGQVPASSVQACAVYCSSWPAATCAQWYNNGYCNCSNGAVVSNPNPQAGGEQYASSCVEYAPSITTQPISQTIITGATATFTVTASGTPAPGYQWMQEAPGASTYTAITGATSASYTTAATTIANSGTQYKCVVTNIAGNVTSIAATLTVNPAVPVVAITGPANNSSFTAGSNMTITASASEINGTINRVFFYNGTTLLGTSAASPYSYTATALLVGTYTLTAIATDSKIVSTTSSPVTVTVRGQPVVTIVSPANQGDFTTGSINITAITSENYGNISQVAFYNGSTLLGTTTIPIPSVTGASRSFTYSWTNVPAGTYNLTAVATDIIGTTASSLPVTGTINPANFTYAVDDNILTKTDALNHTTGYQYDNLNRPIKTTFADASTVSTAYDLFGNQTSVTDQRGNTLIKTYDAYERLSQTKDPNGGITQFNYDTEGRLLTLTDANNNPTSYTYDGDGRVSTQTNALDFATAFTYDPVGNVSNRTDANGKATIYTYDALNHLTNTAYPDSTSVASVYDAIGRKTSMTDATGQTAYTYDVLNRLLTKTSPGTNNKITYTYDSESNRLTSVDQNNRIITNTFDTLNRLASVKDPNGTTSYGYDAVSNKNLVTSPNGVSEIYTYDVLNRVLTVINGTSSGVISSFTNAYDPAGMITKKSFQDGSWTAYSYDVLNRLLEETKQTSSSIVYDYVYTYDPVGNRLTWTKNTTLGGFWNTDYLNMPPQVLTNMTSAEYGNTANSTQALTLARSYTYDAANRLSNWNYAANIYGSSFSVQADSYTYDQNGNRLTKQAVLTGQEATPQQTTYNYDFENRLLVMSLPNVGSPDTTNFTYNGEGLRTQVNLNNVAANYLYDGSNILVERNGSNVTTKSYTRGLDFGGGIGSLINQTASGTTQYYQYNDLGSVANLTTTTGATAGAYSYDAFGNLFTPQANGDTNRYLFSTKEFDSRSGLDYFGGRYYDPEIGRWLTPDPLGMVNGPNRYLYCLNNPLNFIDPYGLEIERQIYGGNFNPEGSIDASNLSLYILLNLGGYSPEQVMNIALGFTPFGEGQAYSEATYNSFLKVLEENGIGSLQKAQQSIQANLDQHLKDFENYQNTGGFTSSVEKEIKTFKSQLDAIKDILKGAN